MGQHYGPHIVTDGLKLLIDPKNDVCNGGKSIMTDLSGNLNSGSLYSGMSLKLGTIEYASDTTIDMAITDSYSITCWVNKRGSNSGNYAHFLDNYNSLRNWAVGNWINTDQLFFEWRRADNAAWTATQLSINLIQDEWNFLAITVTSGGAGGTKTIVTRLYNSAGAPTTTTKTTTDDWLDSGTGNFEIGRSQSNGTYFNGELSDVRVYKTVLSLSDINTIYNAPNTVLPGAVSGSQLVGWWPMIEGSGTKVLDNSSNNFNGTLYNSATWVSGSATIPQTTTGFEYSSSLVPNPNEGWLDFDGSNDYVKLPTSLPDAPTALSVCFWLYPDAWDTGTNGGWILDSPELDVVIGTHTDDDYMYFNRDNVNRTTYNVPTVTTWTHVLATWTSTSANAVVYHNGVVQSTSTAANYGTIGVGGGDNIGRRTNGTYQFDGKITSFKIYDRVLSSAEVLQNFNAQRGRFGV